MPNLEVPGAKLYYESEGSGPILLFIPGASGGGNVFKRVAKSLLDEFTVVMYDRRGFSRSYLTGEQDYAHRLERDADDAAALIKQVSNGDPAFVFATSSGAVVGRTLLFRHSGLVKKIMLHEPPLCAALPEEIRGPYVAGTRKAYNDYREKGPITAIEEFVKINYTPEEAQFLLLGGKAHADPFAVGNEIYWFERELLIYPFEDLGLEELEKHRDRILFATSAEASHLPAGQIPQLLAQKLGMKAVVMPGAHCGYLVEAQDFGLALSTYMG